MYSTDEVKKIFNSTKNLLSKDISVDDLDDLKAILRFHEWKYYVQNDPILSDGEYDQLFNSLKKIEEKKPELITPDSPTQRVATDIVSDAGSVAHLTPMLSLANAYNREDLIDFDSQIRKLCLLGPDHAIQYCVEPKFDGGSVALVYENDLLIRAATRGNGTRGEEMTHNAKVMPSIPLRADFSDYGMKTVELRGEAVIRKDTFEKVNKLREKDGLIVFANPRNAATGGLRVKDPNDAKKRKIEVFIFQMGYAIDQNGQDVLQSTPGQYQQIEMLEKLGFKTPTIEKKLCENILEAADFVENWEQKRDNYNYEIDGMVIKVNDPALQQKSGSTQHHPRWAIAYKFKAKQATTRLVDVEYQVGKIGSVTPVAKLEPVQLAGVTVSSVSLHNEEFIISKDLRLGDTVLVERAGDVIPYIVKSFSELRDGTEIAIEFPKYCPSCQTKLVQEEGESAWRCVNPHCEAQILQKMIFHVSKDAMDIDGFGKSYVERFFELGWIQDISDIYRLDFEKIASLEGFGERSAANIKKAIEKAKHNPLQRILHSLSIHHLGKKASKLLAQEINHALDLVHWDEEKFTKIKDIGPVVAKNVIAYFGEDNNVEILKKMEKNGVDLHQKEADKPLVISKNAPLAGKTILFTGSLMQMGRKQAQKLAEENGAKNISAVSKNLDILVAGEKAGSKLKKANSLGTVTVMTEDEFLKLINYTS